MGNRIQIKAGSHRNFKNIRPYKTYQIPFKMMKKKIYIAGKVTGLPQQHVIDKFKLAAILLEELGYQPVNPIEVVNDFNTPWDVAMKKCIKALVDCDAVYLLPCWKHSEGAKIEKGMAESLKIPTVNFTYSLKELWNEPTP